MMLQGRRYGDYVNQHSIGGVPISRTDWNRLHVTFVEQGLHPVFLKSLDLAWEIVFARPESDIGSWKRLFILVDGFWQQRPKKNHVGDSDHGSLLIVDGMNGLILDHGMISRLDDKVNGIDGVNMYSQTMEPFLFEQKLNEMKATGCVIEVCGKDGDIGAPAIFQRVFRNGKIGRCWIHGHRTVYKEIDPIKNKYVRTVCASCKRSKKTLASCTHYGNKVRCSCPLTTTEKSIDHKPIDSANGIANRAQAAIANVFVHLHRTYPAFVNGTPNQKFPGTQAVRVECDRRVDVVLDHFFNKAHLECSLEDDSNHPPLNEEGVVGKEHIRAGHYITCPDQQAEFKHLVKRKLGLLNLDKEHGMWNTTVGLLTTNWVETAIGYIAGIRLKFLKYLAEENREREELGATYQQSVRLGRLGIEFVPKLEILKQLEKVMQLQAGSLVDKRTELYLRKDLADRITKADAQTSTEYRKRKQEQRFKKRNSKKNGNKQGDVNDYDNNHNQDLHNEIGSSQSSKSKKKQRRNYKCSICNKSNDHNKRNCPQQASMLSHVAQVAQVPR